MEGLKLHKYIFIVFTLFSYTVSAEDFFDKKVVSIGYFKEVYGHVHKNPFRYSLGLTTVSCGHPLKILKAKSNKKGVYREYFAKSWRYVKIGPYHGYIKDKFISRKRPICIQDKYPKFFEKINLEISDMYYWGKLYDQYLLGKSKAQ
jgi:hypothetical protein